MSERVGGAERVVLERTRARLAARHVEYFRLLVDVAELDRCGVAARTGDRLVERLVENLARCDRREATRLVDEARDLVARVAMDGQPLAPRLPATSAALAGGAIGEAHVAIIRRTMQRLEQLEHLLPEVVAQAEQSLAEKARELAPAGLSKAAARLLAHLDPDGAAPAPEEGRADTVQLLHRRNGTLELRATISDAAAAAMIDDGFEVMSGRAGPDDDRDLPARRADAFKELFAAANGSAGLITDTRHETPDQPADTEPAGEPADTEPGQGALIPAPRRPDDRPDTRAEPTSTATGAAATRAAGSGAGRALLTITIGHDWLRRAVGHGVLDNDALVDVESVRRWACDADIVPVVLGTRSEPLDIGRRSRAVTDAIRRALNVRDRGCAFPGCTRRPRRCQAHHIEHWVDGGPTDLDNLVLLCLHHHQQVHHAHWRIDMIDGRPWFFPPSWIDPERRPRLGGRPLVAA